jgi:DNA repair protein RecO (recombination protein O)
VSTLRTQALILRSVEFGEADRILHLLVPEKGRLTAIAKSARRSVKRFGGTLDFFNLLDVQIERRRPTSMSRLDQSQLVHSYAALRSDPARFALGCYLLELLDRLAPEGGSRPDMQRLFAFARWALEAIASHTPDPRLRTILEIRALDALGLRPELRLCVRCGEEAGVRAEVDFHVADGGTVCGRCAMRQNGGLLRVHLGTLRALEQCLRLDAERLDRLSLSPAALAEARRLVTRFQHFHVGVTLASERFLDRLVPDPPRVP